MCDKCTLCNHCTNPKQTYVGKGLLKVLIIDDAPDLSQDTHGLDRGQKYLFLTSVFKEIGVDLSRDLWYTTTVGCYTGSTKKIQNVPTHAQIQECFPRLQGIIDELNPTVLILLGNTPAHALITPRIKGRLTGTSASDFRGCHIPDQELQRWVCPTWDLRDLFAVKVYEGGNISKPLYMRDKAIYKQFRQHLFESVSLYNTPVDVVDYDAKCYTTMNVDVAIEWIIEALSWEYVALDYETTGLKPHREGHKIVCASISNGHVSYAFPFFADIGFRRMWKRLMTSQIGKIAHNNQFEASWTFVRSGYYWVKPWIWDTMLGAHALNNKGPTGLKWCTYVNTGVIGYDDGVDKYLSATPDEVEKYGCNAINRIDQAPIEEVLKYNALDSLFTAILYEKQKKEMTPFQLEGMSLLVNTATTLARTSENGMIVAEDQFEAVENDLKEKLAQMEKAILASEEASLWDGEEPFNFNSTVQLGHLIYDIMGVKPVKFTPTLDKKTGEPKPSLDKEAFEKLNIPFLKKIEAYRETAKMCSTYIEGWKRETVDGKLHSFFKLNTVDTFRSASSEPNLQNSYKRDKIKRDIVRSLAKAESNARIVEYDYKSLEVIVNGCHSNDKNLVMYCTDPSTDMHTDGTMDVFMLEKEGVKKEYRNSVKGLYIFSEFYGNYYGAIAKDLWDFIEETPALKEHIRAKGFSTVEKYTAYIQKCEEKLWNERFKGHNAWRKDQWNTYQKKGYLESFTGFRLQAPMSRNNTYNCKVQGDGFHCLCYLMNHLQEKIDELELKSYIINEIHDSLVMMVYPEEEAIIDYWVWYFGTQQIQEEWKWITIPLQIEKERSEIGGVWCKMEGCGYLDGKSLDRVA